MFVVIPFQIAASSAVTRSNKFVATKQRKLNLQAADASFDVRGHHI